MRIKIVVFLSLIFLLLASSSNLVGMLEKYPVCASRVCALAAGTTSIDENPNAFVVSSANQLVWVDWSVLDAWYLFAYQVVIIYDPSQATFNTINVGQSQSGFIFSGQPHQSVLTLPTSSRICVGCYLAGSDGVSGSGKLVSVSFNLTATVGTTVRFYFDVSTDFHGNHLETYLTNPWSADMNYTYDPSEGIIPSCQPAYTITTTSSIHEGNLTLSGCQNFIIENCTYNEVGTISLSGSAKLILTNADLRFNLTSDWQDAIRTTENASIIMNNSTIVTDRISWLYLGESSHIFINNTRISSPMEDLFQRPALIAFDKTEVFAENSQVESIFGFGNTSIVINNLASNRVVCGDSSNIFVFHSTLGTAIVYLRYYLAEAKLGTHFIDYFNTYENLTSANTSLDEREAGNFTVVNSTVIESISLFLAPSPQPASLHKPSSYSNTITIFNTATIVGASGYRPPMADAGPNQTVYQGVSLNLSVSVDSLIYNCVNAYAPNLVYNWSFVDTIPKAVFGPNASYTFNTPGTYEVVLKVADALGNLRSDNTYVTVIAIPLWNQLWFIVIVFIVLATIVFSSVAFWWGKRGGWIGQLQRLVRQYAWDRTAEKVFETRLKKLKEKADPETRQRIDEYLPHIIAFERGQRAKREGIPGQN